MSTLQWALLLLGIGIAVLLVVSSRREKRALERPAERGGASPSPMSRDWAPEREPAAPVDLPPPAPPAVPPPATVPAAGRSFDEFGVGKPRRRVAPEVGMTASAPSTPSAASAPTASPSVPSVPQKLIGLYIAEHEGTNILGPKIHAALQQRGLTYGARKIYHRLAGDRPQFSVASLVKPGSLDPAEAEGFATPGLSVFMVLPGPDQPVAALDDMLETARALAKSLNAELYDSEERAPLSGERERSLRRQVEEWAQRGAAPVPPRV